MGPCRTRACFASSSSRKWRRATAGLTARLLAARERRDAALAARLAGVARRVPVAAVAVRFVPVAFARVFFAAGPRRALVFRAAADRGVVVFAFAPVFLRAVFLAVFAAAALRGARAAVGRRVALFLAGFRFADVRRVAFAVLLLRLLGLIARLRLAEPRVMHDFANSHFTNPCFT